MNSMSEKSGKFQDYEFPEGWTAKDQIDFINGMLSDSSIASVELYIDTEDKELVARAWFAKV